MTSGQRRDFITVVSGLPRSGTSMMMRMLEAGGMPVVTDHERRPDADNPDGYYEFERVKKLKKDPAWLADAVGAAVKVIYLLLYDLPSHYRYRLIFMRRNIEEVIASQEAMLERAGGGPSGVNSWDMVQLFEIHLRRADEWLRRQDNFVVLNLQYDQVVEDPAAAAVQVAEFLGGGLDPQTMAAIVDPALYRQRAAPSHGSS